MTAHNMQGWLGIGLVILSAALVAFGIVKRRERRRIVHPPGSIRPEFAGMTAIVRPLLLGSIGFFAVETCLHYYFLGGRALLAPLDFAGILVLLTAFAIYVLLAMIRPAHSTGHPPADQLQ